MSFWSSFFTKANDEHVKEDSVIDENGWRVLPNGIRFKNAQNTDGTLGDIFAECVKELGYNGGELYEKYNYSNLSPFIVGYFQLLTRKLIGIARDDNVKMTMSEINTFVKEYCSLSENEEEDLLRDGIENHNISQSYIETILSQKCNEDQLSNEKYLFSFENGYLTDFKRLDKYSADARDFLVINAYYEEAQEWYKEDEESIINEINLQASCFVNLDLNILNSIETRMRFLYSNGFSNMIAMAAYYKSKDVLLDEFINSTHGHYEIVAKEIKGGKTITRVKAYGLTFVFVNGHSNENSIVDEPINEEESNVGQGYVYVMVNPSLPNMVKIGKTTKDPNDRAKELSATTGVPTPFMAIFYKPFINCDITEKTIHNYLGQKGCRVNDNREFFYLSANDAIAIVQNYYDLEQKDYNPTDEESEL